MMVTTNAQYYLDEVKEDAQLTLHHVFLESEIGFVVLDSNSRLVS